MGALTILEFLRNYGPGHVSRVVLVDQSPRMLTAPDWPLALFGGFRTTDSLEFESQIRADATDAWLALQARGHVACVESVPQGREYGARHPLATGSMLALWRSMIARDYRADLAALQVPLLAVLGSDSNLYDAALLGRWFQQNVPGAQVASYPKAGHAPHAASPARFARDVAAFAAQRTPPSRNHVVVVAQNGASVPRPALARVAA
jgi:pimeloyl-ACP methyl ester carboxylesterase